MKKKILLFSPPFSGHLYILKNLANRYKDLFDFKLIVTGWGNIEPDLKNLEVPCEILTYSDLHETDPALWTLPRTAELLEDCLNKARDFKPDLIIYDFFSLEGHLVGKILNIPFFCSIPALIGPFVHQEYLKKKLADPGNLAAIKTIQTKYPDILAVEKIEMISDGLHLPASKNFLWSYSALTPKDFLTGRVKHNYIFVGRLDWPPTDFFVSKPLVYFSLGTVVMDNLWNQQPEIKNKLKETIEKLTKLWSQTNFNVLFVARGRNLANQYPKNWQVVDYADQIKVLSKAAVFVTHAGGSSFHEAVLAKVPMVAMPFFGDQPLIAKQIEKLGLGFNLVPGDNIDTKKSKDFLNSQLAEKIDQAVRQILAAPEKFQNNFLRLALEAENILDFIR